MLHANTHIKWPMHLVLVYHALLFTDAVILLIFVFVDKVYVNNTFWYDKGRGAYIFCDLVMSC
jgi:hypothetical protein